MKKINFLKIFAISTALLIIACEKASLTNSNSDFSLYTEENAFISSEKAQHVATQFATNLFSNSVTKSGPSIIKEMVNISSDTGEPLMYIINYVPEGFVIVGASKDYYPILAYSENGFYSVEDTDSPVNIFWLNETKNTISKSKYFPNSIKIAMRYLWLNYSDKAIRCTTNNPATKAYGNNDPMEAQFQARIAELKEELGGAVTFYRLSEIGMTEFPDTPGAYMHYCQMAQEAGSPLEYTIIGLCGGSLTKTTGPLLTTQWRQDFGFNLLCANYPEPAGCGPIAIAQIMKFHKYPTSYNWTAMPNNTASYETQILIRDIQNLSTDSASASKIINTFEHFGYSTSISMYSEDATIDEIVNDNQPFIMQGWTENDLGHSWVCDGVQRTYNTSGYFIEFYIDGEYCSLEFAPSKDDVVYVSSPVSYYFHQNWGWGPGGGNGWYSPNDVSTRNGNFNISRQSIYISK